MELPQLAHLDLALSLYSTRPVSGDSLVPHPLPAWFHCPRLVSLELRVDTERLDAPALVVRDARPLFPNAQKLLIHGIQWPGDPAGLKALEALLKHTPGARRDPRSCVGPCMLQFTGDCERRYVVQFLNNWRSVSRGRG